MGEFDNIKNGTVGLRGLAGLSEDAVKWWRRENASKLKGKTPEKEDRLFKNQQFINYFGIDTFKAYKGRTSERDALYKEALLKSEFRNNHSSVELNIQPFKKTKIGYSSNIQDWTNGTPKSGTYTEKPSTSTNIKYDMDKEDFDFFMNHDSRYIEQLNESGFRGFKKINEDAQKTIEGLDLTKKLSTAEGAAFLSGLESAKDAAKLGINDAIKADKNIITAIRENYRKDVEESAQDEIFRLMDTKYDLSSDDANQAFLSTIETTDTNIGNNHFKAFYDNGKEGSIVDSMSVYDKRYYLAYREALLNAGLPQEEVAKMLEDWAQNYIADHQSFWTKRKAEAMRFASVGVGYGVPKLGGMFIGDVASSIRDGRDLLVGRDKPQVFTNPETGDIIDPKNVHAVIDKQGNHIGYRDTRTGENVILTDISHSQAFRAGVNTAGESLTGIQNQQYLNDVQQFNTFDRDEIEKAKLNGGISTHNKIYHVGETQSFAESVIDMAPFAIVDGADLALTVALTRGAGGVGAAVKGARTATALSNIQKATQALRRTGNAIGTAVYQTAPIRGAVSIGYGYSGNTFTQGMQENMEKLREANFALATENVENYISNNLAQYNKAVDDAYKKLKKEDNLRVQSGNTEGTTNLPISDETLREMAEEQVRRQLLSNAYNDIVNSPENASNITTARDKANTAAIVDLVGETAKYATVNYGFRKFLFKTPEALANAEAEAAVSSVHEEVVNGVKRLVKEPFSRKSKIPAVLWSQVFGGGWTNFTDEMQTDFSLGANSSAYTNYLLDQANGQAYNKFHQDNLWYRTSVLNGALNSFIGSTFEGTTWEAGAVGAVGSITPTITLQNLVSAVNFADVQLKRKAYLDKASENLKSGKWDRATYDRAVQLNPYQFFDNNATLSEKVSPFLTSGFLNTYAASRVADRNLAAQVDAINKYSQDVLSLDALKKTLIAMHPNSTTGELDKKDIQIIKALYLLRALQDQRNFNNTVEGAQVNQLMNKVSAYKDAMSVIDEFEQNGEHLTEDTKKQLLGEYYNTNPNAVSNEANDAKVIEDIEDSLHDLHKASVAVDEAQAKLAEWKKNNPNKPLDSTIENALTNYEALYALGDKRIMTMEKEVSGQDYNDVQESKGKDFLFSFGDSKGSISNHINSIRAYRGDIATQVKDVKQAIENNRKRLSELEAPSETAPILDQHAYADKVQDLQTEIADLNEQLEHLNTVDSKLSDAEELLKIEADEYYKNLSDEQVAENEYKRVTFEEVFGNVDFSNNKSLSESADKFLSMPWSTRARLLKNYREETARRSSPDAKETLSIFDDTNYSKLKRLFDFIDTYKSGTLDKVRDIDILKRRQGSIQEQIRLGYNNPEVALRRYQTSMSVETERASALWLHNMSQVLNAVGEAELSKIRYKDLLHPVKSKKWKNSYKKLFDFYKNADASLLRRAINTANDPTIKDLLQKALDYSTTLKDIEVAIKVQNIELPKSTFNTIKDIIEGATDSEFPTRDDLIYALETLKDAPLMGVDLNKVYEQLQEIDELRGSNVIETAKERNARKEVKKQHDKLRKQREEAVKKQVEEETKKKAEEKNRKQQELQGTPKKDTVQPGPQNGHPTGENIVDNGKQGDLAHMTGQGDQVDLYSDPNDNALATPDFESQAATLNAQTHKEGQPDKVSSASTQTVVEQETAPQPIEVSDLLIGHMRQEYDNKSLPNLQRFTTVPSVHWSNLYSFLDSKGIKLSNIVDHELGRILKNNPDTVVRFMTVNPTTNSSIGNQIFTVIEATNEVKAMHKDSNGGIIKAQDGIEYLIIGTLGYDSKVKDMQNSYNTVAGGVFKNRSNTNLNNSDYYVDGQFSTHVANMYGGNKVQSLTTDVDAEGNPVQQQRSIIDLIRDPSRNPYGLEVEDLKWLIQTHDAENPLIINPGINNTFYRVTDVPSNLGNVFVYILASNGAYIPIQISPRTLNEIPDGRLKQTIDDAINKLNSLDWEERKAAASVLDKLIFYNTDGVTRRNVASKQGKMLWVGSETNPTITLKDGDVLFRSFPLNDPNFSIEELRKAIYEHNPRIQITPGILSNVDTIEMYAEAGCLNTDIASLATYNANYYLGSMNANGTEAPRRHAPTDKTNSGFDSFYNGVRYSLREGKWQDEYGNSVSNPHLIYQLEMNYKIKTQDLHDISDPNRGTDNNERFIISNDKDNPIVVSRDKNTYEVSQPAPKEVALEIIDKYEKEKKMAEQFEANKKAAEQVDLNTIINPDTGTTEKAEVQAPKGENKTVADSNTNESKKESAGPSKSIESSGGKHGVTALQVANSIDYIERFYEVTNKPDWGITEETDTEDIVKILQEHGISTDNILDVDDWLDNIENCK